MIDQDVLRLEIAVHHQVLVREGDRGAHGAEELQSFAQREVVAFAEAVDRLALDVLHHQVG